MKTARQSLILDIIKDNIVETQEELARLLIESGVNITQATVSRDIKDLNLIKVQSESGKYKYAASIDVGSHKNLAVLIKIFKSSVKSVNLAGNMVVVKTLSGSGNAACEMIDNLDVKEIIGTLAGDNTIFIATKSNEDASVVLKTLDDIIK